MKRVCRGPNQYRRFEEQPTTTNGVYGFEVLSQVRIAKAQAVGHALACCLPPTFPVIRPPCPRRPHLTNLVAVNPSVDYFIAPRLCSIRDPPYTPTANKRDIYVGDRCSEVKPRLVECRERNTNGTLITKSVKRRRRSSSWSTSRVSHYEVGGAVRKTPSSQLCQSLNFHATAKILDRKVTDASWECAGHHTRP
ncbi:hypothetical protein EGR_05586 [Echinococcus granulosus]|uniref:Uncharacterized protein n=1 Tax=Echinococcus granulosus TaxID=6210 RepID=W6V159_ECHGR|nr:hypothetical protein EGR_05586 [Echinococcus granulosus]EUB59559.1 hypothetical protein EGR_05586 [Echinococcus granulosus]